MSDNLANIGSSEDIEGFCAIMEASITAAMPGQLGVGNTGTAMFFGISLKSSIFSKETGKRFLWDTLMGPPYTAGRKIYNAIRDVRSGGVPTIDPLELANYAKGMLLMDGFGTPWASSVGLSVSYGYLWTGAVSPLGDIDIQITGSQEGLTTRSSSVGYENGTIKLNGDVLFDFDKYVVKKEAEPYLKIVGRFLTLVSPYYIAIEGHTDSVGQPEYNVGLSRRRAQSVKNWFASNGVKFSDLQNVVAIGHGASKPVASNDTEEGRARNRRVEIKFDQR